MKTHIICSVFLVAFLVTFAACSLIKLSTEEPGLVASIVSRRVGVELQKSYPEIAQQVESACNFVLELDALTDEYADNLKNIIAGVVVEDELLRADLSDLLSMVTIAPDVGITQEQIVLIRIIAAGLKSGITIGGADG